MKRISGILNLDHLFVRFFKGIFWSLINAVFGQGFSFILTVVIANFLGREDYGRYTLFLNTFIMFASFTAVGLPLTLTKYVPQFKDSIKSIRKLLLYSLIVVSATSLAVMVYIYFNSNQFAEKFLNNVEGALILRIALPLIFVISLNQLLSAILSGFEKFKFTAITNIIKNVVFFVLIIVRHNIDVLDLLILYLVTNGILQLFLLYAVYSAYQAIEVNSDADTCLNYWSMFKKFSFPAFLSGVVGLPIVWLSQTLMTKLDGGYAKIGMLNAALQWQQVIILLPVAMTNVALPMLSQYSTKDEDRPSFMKIFKMNQWITLYIILPISLIICYLGDLILKIYGKGFSEGYSLFIMIVVGISISAIGYPASSAIQAKGKMWLSVAMNGIWGGLLFILTLLLMPSYGIYAYGLSFLASHIILFLWSYIYLSDELGRSNVIRSIATALCFLTLASISLFMNLSFRMIAILPVLVISFIILNFLFPLVSKAKIRLSAIS